MGFQDAPGVVTWRIHLDSAPDLVFDALDTQEGRESFWADSASERNGIIEFRIGSYPNYYARIAARERPSLFALRYFDTDAAFELQPDGKGGTDLTLRATGVPEDSRTEFIAGWVSLLLTMKAAIDHGIDLRNHDPSRSWITGYADN
jgi:uncharacterized protein YndB with AHSA1/START domain